MVSLRKGRLREQLKESHVFQYPVHPVFADLREIRELFENIKRNLMGARQKRFNEPVELSP